MYASSQQRTDRLNADTLSLIIHQYYIPVLHSQHAQGFRRTKFLQSQPAAPNQVLGKTSKPQVLKMSSAAKVVTTSDVKLGIGTRFEKEIKK